MLAKESLMDDLAVIVVFVDTGKRGIGDKDHRAEDENDNRPENWR